MLIHQMGFFLNLDLPKQPMKLVPGDIIEILICDYQNIKTSNFYVNVANMKNTLQKFQSIINVHSNNNSNNLVSKDQIKEDEIVLGLDKLWHRAIKTDKPGKFLAIDDGFVFEPNTIIKCDKCIAEIQPFAINVKLAGVHNTKFSLSVFQEFLRRQDRFKIKIILINNQNKLYVEMFNDNHQSLNFLLNNKFQKEIFHYN